MATTGLTIDRNSITDNPSDYQVEFTADVDGETQAFAVKYSALEALAGAKVHDGDPLAAATAQIDRLGEAAGKALARGPASDPVTIGEADLL